MTSIRNMEGCATANACIMVDASNPLCGSVPTDLPPLPLAEELCHRALKGAYDRIEEQEPRAERPTDVAQKLLDLGSCRLEQALHTAVGAGMSGDYFDDADIFLERAVNDPDGHPQNRYQAAILRAHLPLFHARRDQQAVNPDDFSAVTQSICAASELIPPDRPFKFRLRHILATATTLSLARVGIANYPSTFRERCAILDGTLSADMYTLAHDSYMIQASKKVPISSRNNNSSGSRLVATLKYNSIISKSMQAVDKDLLESHPDSELRANLVYEWLIREARGEDFIDSRVPEVLKQVSIGVAGAIVRFVEAREAAGTNAVGDAQSAPSNPLRNVPVPNLPALPPAEAIRYPALREVHKHWANTSRKAALSDIFCRACSHLEVALHPATEQTSSDDHFERSEKDLRRVIAQGVPDGRLTVYAQELASQMEIMRLRNSGELPSVSMIREHRARLLQLINIAPEAADTVHDFSPFYEGILFQQLVLRRRYMVYRSTAREAHNYHLEQAADPRGEQHAYHMLNGEGDKVPIELSQAPFSANSYRGRVAKIHLKQLVQRAARQNVEGLHDQFSYTDLSRTMLTWLRDEVHDLPLPPSRKWVLNALSGRVISTVLSHKKSKK